MSSSGGGAGGASRAQWALTVFSTAWPRFCQRWNRSATCTACGAPCQRYLRRFRTGRGHAPHPGPKPPTVRQVTSWIMTHPDHLDPRDAAKLGDLCHRDRDLNQLVKHVRAFAVVTGRHGERLDDWITAVEHDTLAPLSGFARSLRRDLDAVRNGLALPHSSGAVEGTIICLKMIKRQMLGGGAGLDLLRNGVLLAPRGFTRSATEPESSHAPRPRRSSG
ncbi:transposase [Micromonospora chersina]|uniref:transposase n=1 Tax=Micromonospora chersina TaxID=47854 RepID=UPI0037A17C15